MAFRISCRGVISSWLLFSSFLAQAQLSHNLSVGNPIALSMGNSVTAYPVGSDSIHYNPAALAKIKNEFTQYKMQMGFIEHSGSISGAAPGQTYAPIEGFEQDPVLQGQLSRDVSVESTSLFLPFFGHTRSPVLVAPGYGFGIRSDNDKFVFAN